MRSKQDLHELVRASMAGDAEAFAQLCEIKAKDILHLCCKLCGGQQSGQDAAQEVLIVMYKNIPALQKAENFNAWLYRIIVRTCNRMRNKEYRARGEYLPEHVSEHLLEDNRDFLPQEFAETQENSRQVLESLALLPERQRQLLVMYYYEELPIRAIALSLGISENNAKVTLHRARAALRKQYEAANNSQLPQSGAAIAGLPLLSQLLHTEADSGEKGLLHRFMAGLGALAAAGAAATPVLSLGAASLVLCGALSIGGILYAGSSAPSSQYSASAAVPQQPHDVAPMSEEGAEDSYIVWLPTGSETDSTPYGGESGREDSTTTSPPHNGPQPDEKEAGEGEPPARVYTVQGQLQFANGAADARSYTAGLRLRLHLNGQDIGTLRTDSSGAFTLYTSQAGSLQLTLLDAPGGLCFANTGTNGYTVLFGGSTELVLTLTDTLAPHLGIGLLDGEDEPVASSINPATAQLQVLDMTEVEVSWQLVRDADSVTTAAGSGTQVPLDQTNCPGETGETVFYTLYATATDAAGNTTTAQCHFVIQR